jgi:hypothetical protein
MARARDARGRFVSASAAADAVVTIGGDASGLERTTARVKQMLGEMDRAVESFAKKSQQGSKAAAKFADEADRLEKVGRVLGGRFNDIGGIFDDVAKVMESGISKTTLMTLGVGALAIAAAAAGVAVVRFGQHVVGVTRNVEGLSKQLTDADRAAMAPYIVRLQEAERALAGFDRAVVRADLSLASLFAPTTTKAADALAGATDAASKLLQVLQTPVDVAGTLGSFALRAAFPTLGILGAGFDAAAEHGESLRQKTYGPELPFGYQPPEKIYGPEAPAGYKPPDATAPRTSGADPLAGFMLGGQVDSIGGVQVGADSGAQARAAADLVIWKLHQDERTKALKEAEDERTQIAARALQDRQANEAMALEEYRRQEAERVAVEAQAYGAISQITGAFFGFASDLIQGQTAETIEERRAQFEAQQAIMYAQAVAGAALAVVQGFAQLGPIAGAVSAVATTAVTALQIATIANAEPSFHVGGTLAADEQLAQVRLRDNEIAAFFTSQAQDRLGGPQAMEDLARTGRGGGRGDAYYFVLDGEVRKFRRFAEPAIMGQNDVRV